MDKTDIPETCAKCPYTKVVERKYGATKHCVKSRIFLDVTHIPNHMRSMFCPLTRDI